MTWSTTLLHTDMQAGHMDGLPQRCLVYLTVVWLFSLCACAVTNAHVLQGGEVT